MKTRKRLTREESKEVTRMRLIEAAERLFIRRGFDNASVEEISEAAGYSRGAFYSNFNDKEQVFLAVIDRRRPKAFDDMFQHSVDCAERIAAVREWFSNQWRLKDFIALRMEFSRKAMRDRAVRRHVAELRGRELETYAGSLNHYLDATDGIPSDRTEIVALALLAVAHGLGSLAIETEPDWENTYTEAAKLVFDRVTAPTLLIKDKSQC
jgi:TetR/AcrR family transcriptional regulator, transcriptional repressor of aconitase